MGMGFLMWARVSMRRRVSGTRPVRRGVALRMDFAMRRSWMSQRVRMVRNPMSQRAARRVGRVRVWCVGAGVVGIGVVRVVDSVKGRENSSMVT
jgi:hypothetical protein